MHSLETLPEVVLRCIIEKLPIQHRCNLAKAHPNFDHLLSENIFWKKLIMGDDKAFVNSVCHYVFEHSKSVQEMVIDNFGSPENSFVTSWTDILLCALTNVRKVHVIHSAFLSDGLFIDHTMRD